MKKLLILLFIFPYLLVAQDTTSNLFDMSLEDLMNVKVEITSPEQEVTVKEAPGIVTIITEDMIKKSGARDLIDVLRLVPGFDFGVDVIGQVGIATRGNWAHEGKFLLMIDGQMMNELSYACTEFGMHYPVENIKRIEIIRGPGSAIYGGFAELSVINIITKNGADIDGVEVGLANGATLKHPSFSNLAYLNMGKKIGDLDISAFVKYANSHRSDFDFVDVLGNSFNLYENTIQPLNVNFKVSYKNLEFVSIFDQYKTKSRDYWGITLSKAYSKNFTTFASMLKYKFKISDKLTITPKVQYLYEKPWESPDPVAPADSGMYYNNLLVDTRLTTNLVANYYVSKFFNFIIGGEYFIDEETIADDDPENTHWNNQKSISYNTVAAFTQINWKNRFFNITLGTRFEKHSLYGGAFVPRIAIMKDFGKVNVKLLYNKAYRSPTVANLDYNYYLHTDVGYPTIKPEYTDFFNSELSFNIAKNSIFVFDMYYINLKDAIIYYVSRDGEGYENLGYTKTAGVEAEFRHKLGKSLLSLTYSYYHTLDNTIEIYKSPSNSALLGLANHKFTSLVNIYVNKNFSLTPSAIFLSKRYAQATSVFSNEAYTVYDPTLLLNLSLNYNWKAFSFSLTGFNLLNEKYEFIQPYLGGHNPLAGRPLEIILKMQVKF